MTETTPLYGRPVRHPCMTEGATPMRTEMFCDNLEALDRKAAIRAIQRAWIQLNAIGFEAEIDGTTYDNSVALSDLASCLEQAEHVGFSE